MKKFKKVYIEITNICNLKCSFCPHTTRKPSFMSFAQFCVILDKIREYTDYIYLHVMGEPLLHPEINRFIQEANSRGFFVNITTNGCLLSKLDENVKVRQTNISLHSYQEKFALEEYLISVFEIAEKLAEKGTYINYRLWTNNEITTKIQNQLKKRYSVHIDKEDKTKVLGKNIFFSREEEFIWPIARVKKSENNYSTLTCRALKDHIAILVDGTVVPCCLDNNASIKLGNIFLDSLKKIMNSTLYISLYRGFNENKKIHPLCQKCDFYSHKL